jgi:hypothetical protein
MDNKIMKKTLFFILFLVTVSFIPCEEALFKAIKDTPIWYDNDKARTDENIAFVLKKDEIVTGSRIRYSKVIVNDSYVYVNVFTYRGDKYEIRTDMLVPADTNSLFDDSWITSFDSNDKVFWIRDCYLNVLFSKNRDAFHKFEYKYIDGYNVLMKAFGDYAGEEEWYEDLEIKRCLEINQTTMYAGGIGNIREFWIKSIININNGYKITVIDSRFGKTGGIDDNYHWNPIIFPTDKPSFNLLLIRDNDYVDMYLETMENKIATFVLVDKTVVVELNNLMKNNTCNLSRITSWPRRADGSMDYPPPSLATDFNNTEETENNGYNATAEFAKEKPANKGSRFKIIMIAGIAVLLGGGAAAFVLMKRK